MIYVYSAINTDLANLNITMIYYQASAYYNLTTTYIEVESEVLISM